MKLSYNFTDLKFDFVAGLAVAALTLPVGVAYAEMLGLPPESGIYTAIFALIGYFILGTSKETMIGPDSAIVTILASSIFAFGITDPVLKIQFIILTTFITGILFFICGFLRLGFISNFLSRPILIGYTNGLAVILILSQLQKFTGVEVKNSNSIFGILDFISGIGTIHFPTLILGMISLLLISFLPLVSKKIPAQILLIMISIVLGSVFELGQYGIKFSPEILSSFPVPVIPDFSLLTGHFPKILIDASAIVLISYPNTMLVSRRLSKDKFSVDPDKEFHAIGLADILSGLFKGFPVAGSNIRTMISMDTGAKTKFAKIFAALSMLSVVLFFPKEFSLIPSVIFAAIIIDSAFGLFDFKELKEIKIFSKYEFRISLICMTGVLVVGVLDGIVIALVMSFINLIRQSSSPHEYEIVYDPGPEIVFEGNSSNKSLIRKEIFLYRFNSPMLFYNFDYFRKKLYERIPGRPELKFIFLDCNPVIYIDITFRDNLIDIIKDLNSKGITMIFCCASESFKNKLTYKLALKKMNTDLFFPDFTSALKTIDATNSNYQKTDKLSEII